MSVLRTFVSVIVADCVRSVVGEWELHGSKKFERKRRLRGHVRHHRLFLQVPAALLCTAHATCTLDAQFRITERKVR